RFSAISTFGHGTIRKFSANSSEMKKMAARDFEDLLQCCIPVFAGLLDEPHNQRLVELLYVTAEWHALAKLRMHTETTLALLDAVTARFGAAIRSFRDTTCQDFTTMELPKEAAACARRELAASSNTGNDIDPVNIWKQQLICGEMSCTGEAPRTSNRKARNLNLKTVKMHFLGDYASHIRLFGTSDSYSTQLVSNISPHFYYTL
ncbi:hypothetical protein BJ165DRAFT_1346661, partial [Panaeolus papilionaceus]